MDDKKKNAESVSGETSQELSFDDVADITGGESAFADVPRVKEHPITEDEKKKV